MMFRAENDQEVGDHRRFSLLVEFDDALRAEKLEGVLDHSDRPLHDALPGRHHGFGLLTAEHVGGDFRGVGQSSQLGPQHLNSGRREVLLKFGMQRCGHLVGVGP